MKILILGDIHLGKSINIGKPGFGKVLNSRINDQFYLLNWVLDKAKEKGVEHIVITGDVYNEPKPHPSIINLFMRFLKAAEKEKIKIHIIDGNHDILRTGSWIESALDLVPIIEMPYASQYKSIETINLDGISITMVPYVDRKMYEVDTTLEALKLLEKQLLPELNKIKPGNISVCIGHLSIENSIPIGDEIDDALNEIFCPPSLFKGWKYTWMGHVHNHQVLHEVTDNEPYYVSHIGSMERSDFSKHEMLGDKYIIILDSNDSFEKIKLPNRNIYKIDISVPEGSVSDDYVINYLYNLNKSNPLKDSIIKLDIVLHPSLKNLDRQRVNGYIYNELGVHYICYFSESRMIDKVFIKNDSGINNSMSPEVAIDLYWDNVTDLTDSEREMCRAIAKDINKSFIEQEV